MQVSSLRRFNASYTYNFQKMNNLYKSLIFNTTKATYFMSWPGDSGRIKILHAPCTELLKLLLKFKFMLSIPKHVRTGILPKY